MSGQRKIANVGEIFGKTETQRIADVAMHGDDRALEVLATPGSTQKKIIPLSEETTTVTAELLVVGKDTDGTLSNGLVRVRPAHFIAGVASAPYDIAIGAKQKTNLDSPAFGNNSSGLTRFDLLYATISFGTLTSITKPLKPIGGGTPSSQPTTVAADPLVTLSIVANVSSSTPLASLPADPGDGSAYNFGLAMVSIANGFSGGAINQSSITPLWTRGFIEGNRSKRASIGGISSATGSVPNPQVAVSTRWNPIQGAVLMWRTATSAAANQYVLDNSIDWRNRLIRVHSLRALGAKHPSAVAGHDIKSVPTSDNSMHHDTGWFSSGPGQTFASGNPGVALNALGLDSVALPTGVASHICVYVDNSVGALNVSVDASYAPVDGTNGDHWTFVVEYSDRFQGF